MSDYNPNDNIRWWWWCWENRNKNWNIQIDIPCIYILFWFLKLWFFKLNFFFSNYLIRKIKSNPREMFFQKDILQISSKFMGEHPCRSAISIKLPIFAEYLFWRTPLGTGSEKCIFFNFLNRVQLTLMIEINVKLITLSWLTSLFEYWTKSFQVKFKF